MKGDAQVIEILNEALSEEMKAINQYVLHAEIFGNWGYCKLEKFEKKLAYEEMEHAEKLIERILFLEGMPGMECSKITVGKDAQEMIKNDHKLEIGAVDLYNRLSSLARKKNDNLTAHIADHLLKAEECHTAKLEAELQKISDMGLEAYLTTKVKD